MTKKLSERSTTSLERLRALLMRKRAAIIKEQRAVAEELNQRHRNDGLRKGIKELERQFGVQLIEPAGIETAERVNGQ